VRWRWIDRNVATDVPNPMHARAEFDPLESWQEVMALAHELGPYGPLVIFCVAPGTACRCAPRLWPRSTNSCAVRASSFARPAAGASVVGPVATHAVAMIQARPGMRPSASIAGLSRRPVMMTLWPGWQVVANASLVAGDRQ
jgi:hypothetical protein